MDGRDGPILIDHRPDQRYKRANSAPDDGQDMPCREIRPTLTRCQPVRKSRRYSFGKVRFMANTPSAKKAVRKIARRTAVNKIRRTRMRGQIRKVEEAVAAGDKKAASEALREAQPIIMKAANKGILHKNTASRKISRLAARVSRI